MSEKVFNVLLLGQTGVGKSTFINACANYALFDSLDSAVNGELTCLIPTKSTTYDCDRKEHVIEFGEDENETHIDGQSATQRCKSYDFPTPLGTLRLIDTPGVGDTRGVDKDAVNFADLFAFISQIKEIHRICILLQANCCRRTVIFDFCMKQLFAHLSKTAKNNICFVFTKARGSDYQPGDSFRMVKSVLQEVASTPPHVRIPLSRENMFCVDNESFTYVVACKKGVKYSKQAKNRFAESWENSVFEYSRLFEYVFNCTEPHKVVDTVSVYEARNIIARLTTPLAEVAQLIQDNITVCENHQRLLNSYKADIAQLRNNLFIPLIEASIIELPYPRTICVSASCAETVQLGSIQKFDYKKKCHSHCYLQNVARETINNAALVNCAAMNGKGYCNVCNCSYMCHMHVYYELKEEHKQIVDKSKQREMRTKEDAKEAALETIRDLEKRRIDLVFEEDCIVESTAKFAHFLKNNAITPYNDSFEEYLRHLIENRKILSEKANGNKESIQNLENTLRKYQEEKRLFDKVMAVNERHEDISPTKIEDCVKKLYNLNIFGKLIKDAVEKQNKARSSEIMQGKQRVVHTLVNGKGLVTSKGVANEENSLYAFLRRPQR